MFGFIIKLLISLYVYPCLYLVYGGPVPILILLLSSECIYSKQLQIPFSPRIKVN